MHNFTETINKDVNLSYWQHISYTAHYDVIIAGAGIVGMHCALEFKHLYPKSNVLILDKDPWPSGASVKNAGFACFGSPSEILDDILNMGESKALDLVEMRFKGLQLLQSRFKNTEIQYEKNGGFELFWNPRVFETTAAQIKYLNSNLKYITGLSHTFKPYKSVKDFNFKGVHAALYNKLEGQLNPELLINGLFTQCIKAGIRILCNSPIVNWTEQTQNILVHTPWNTFTGQHLLLCTNGYTKSLWPDVNMTPARAQVLITEPIPNLTWKGCFHFDAGYYYFRTINQRILFGGGRNTDRETESTALEGINHRIQNHLQELLAKRIYTQKSIKIEMRWSGIMGMGLEKYPLLEPYSKRVFTCIRMGGMGIALAAFVAKKAITSFFK